MSPSPYVFKIPRIWAWAKVDNITAVIRGASPRPKGDPRYFNGPIPWIMISDVSREPGKYLTKTREGVTEEGAKRSRLLQPGSLILSNSGTVCVPKILGLSGCIHDGFVTFPSLPDSISKDFLYHWFDFIRPKVIQANKQGITQVNLNTDIVRELDVPIPPAPEQSRIVAKIEELFSDLDAGVAALKRAKANLKRYRAAVLKAAVEGKLAEAWRAEHPDAEPATKLLARILTERRKKWEGDQLAKFAAAKNEPPKNWREKYVEPKPPDMTRLPQLPDGWCWASVEQLCDVGTGTTPSRSNSQFYDSGTIPWIMSTAVNRPFVDEASEFVTDDAVQDTTLRLYPAGTLLVALYGEGKTRGMITELRIAATINQALGALVFHHSAELVRPYVKQYLTSSYTQLRRKAAGGMQPNLNLGIVKQIPIPLPPLDEQTVITGLLAERLSLIDAAEASIYHSLLRAARLRQSILKQAFEGKLVPQDPNDEPASVLLERLRANRSVHEGNGKLPSPARKCGRGAKSKQAEGRDAE